MVYRFLLLSDEVENFERIIEIDSEATFIDFRDIILKSVGYTNSNLTTFYICSEDWEKEQEILFMEMDTDSSVDTYLMENTKLEDAVKKGGSTNVFDDDLYDDNLYNEDEFDPDGFSDMSFDEN